MAVPETRTASATSTAISEPAKTQSLQRAERTQIISSPEEYEQALESWSGRFNILTPFTAIMGLAPQHVIIATQVKLSSDVSKHGPQEVYGDVPWLGTGEFAPSKIGLRKLAECGAISTDSIRTDPRTINDLWEMKGIASYTGLDGRTVVRTATQEWDLRDGSARTRGWTPAQKLEGRKNGIRNCEARAINAAIRECGAGIKQKYSLDELKKPFMVVRVAWIPDRQDPEQMRMVAANALRGTSTFYGGAPQLASGSAAGDVVDADVVDSARPVGQGKAEEKPDPNQPPCEGAVRVAEVRQRNGETNGRKWLRFEVVDSNGEVCSTFDKSVADAASRAAESKAWVELVCETNGNYRNLIEIIPAGSEPKLPTLGEL